jgi:Putative addiction module component
MVFPPARYYSKVMSDDARQLLEEALRLSLAERADLAAELLASMDGVPDADADEAWAVEIERRAKRALSGESKGRDWDVVRAELEAKLRRG